MNQHSRFYYSKLCEDTGHLLCPETPIGGCAIEACPEGLFTNCQWYSFFGKRYYKGWFDIEELAAFFMHFGYHFAVKRTDDNRIQYITQPEKDKENRRPATRGILLENIKDLHWQNGIIFETTGLNLLDVFFKIYLQIKYLKKWRNLTFNEFYDCFETTDELNSMTQGDFSSKQSVDQPNLGIQLEDLKELGFTDNSFEDGKLQYQLDDYDLNDSDSDEEELTETDEFKKADDSEIIESNPTIQLEDLKEIGFTDTDFGNGKLLYSLDNYDLEDSDSEGVESIESDRHSIKETNKDKIINDLSYLNFTENSLEDGKLKIDLSNYDVDESDEESINGDETVNEKGLQDDETNSIEKPKIDLTEIGFNSSHVIDGKLQYSLEDMYDSDAEEEVDNEIEERDQVVTNYIDVSASNLEASAFEEKHLNWAEEVEKEYPLESNTKLVCNVPVQELKEDNPAKSIFYKKDLEQSESEFIEEEEGGKIEGNKNVEVNVADKIETGDQQTPEDTAQYTTSEIIMNTEGKGNIEQDASSIDQNHRNYDIIDNFFSTSEDKIDTVCCRVPKIIDFDNFTAPINLVDQFLGTNPDTECLFNFYEIMTKYLDFMANMTEISVTSKDFVKKFIHFRHDIFSFLFTKFVVKRPTLFGTDEQLPFIDYQKTPDLWFQEDKKITIIEFTVVANSLTANFLKGVDNSTSKYKKEISLYNSMGMEVLYYPIFFSTGATIESNAVIWENYGFEITSDFIKLISEFRSLMRDDLQYLMVLGFKEDVGRELSGAQDFLDKRYNYGEGDIWEYKSFKANKVALYKMINCINNFVVDPDSNYVLKRSKNGEFFIIKVIVWNKFTISGKDLIFLKSDHYSIYKKYEHYCRGFDDCYLRTRNHLKEIEKDSPKHGFQVDIISEDSPFKIPNKRLLNVYSYDDCFKLDKLLKTESMNQLNKILTVESVQLALKKYDDKIRDWKIESNTNVPIENNPRRSFICMIDSEMTAEIDYTKGLSFKCLNENDIKSLSLRLLLTRKSLIIGSDSLGVDEKNDELLIQYKKASSNLYSFLKDCKFETKKFSKVELHLKANNIENYNRFIYLKDELKKAQKNYGLSVDKNSKTKYIKAWPDVKKSFKQETNWKGNRGFKLYMGDFKDIQSLTDIMKSLTRCININLSLPENEHDSRFFKQLKEFAGEEYKSAMKELMTTKLFSQAVFLSRLAYTLLALSNKSFNGDKFTLDNLGLSDVVLAVKGGKKIASTRKSKIFKLVYPAERNLESWNPNTFMSSGEFFDETPWMQLHQEVLLDFLSAPYKLAANYLYLREMMTANQSFEILTFPTLLMMHNRRKTEITLHNMRYLCVNPLAEMTQLDSMIQEFAAPSYTAFDYSIRKGLSLYYMKYFNSIKEWSQYQSNEDSLFEQIAVHHPFLKRKILNIHDFTYVIYSTYMMTKGHFDQSIEQVNNLKSILETHVVYEEMNTDHYYNIFNEVDRNNLKNDDFGYSPIVSYNVGKLLAAEFRAKHAVGHLNTKWFNLMDEPIDIMANNRGLRMKGKDFFGHKGYYVVYKELLETGVEKILDILNDDDELRIHKKLREINVSFAKEQKNKKLDKVKFHVVDKSQRGGGREIYVMDYLTKLYQHPIEKMFKFMCSFIDNEIISIPSAQRAGLIHKKCFEYRSDKYTTYYMTYDCRKWAPRSNPDKYLDMLMGLRDVLPEDFVLSVIYYFMHHKNKEISTRREIADKFLSNPDNREKYGKILKEDTEDNRVFFVMPYSFVMGIFNMLSSLLHAGVQKYAKILLEEDYLLKGKRIDFDMYAHSDDSGGRLSVENNTEFDLTKFVGSYEFIMKCANHLMSVKKCSTSRTYFELLSVLYMNHELLPLLPKFLGNIRITFTGQGLSSDMKQVISKSIELLSNGASGAQTWKVQILLSNMYRNFYRVNQDTQIPALGGYVNSWPTLYQIYGSGVDEIRSSIYNYDFFSRFSKFAVEFLDYEVNDGTINLKYKNIIRQPKAYRDFSKLVKLPEFNDAQWFFENNKTNNSALNLFWFRAKLESSTFSTSIMNINEIRRAFDSLYMATGFKILGKFTYYSINGLISAILNTEPNQKTGYEDVLYMMYNKLRNLFFHLDELDPITLAPKLSLSVKPASLSLNQFVDAPITQYNSLNLATQMCRPELMKYTFSNKRYGAELDAMKKFLFNHGIDINIKDVKSFLDYLQKVKNQTLNYYCATKSDSRALVGDDGCFQLIIQNVHSKRKIMNNYSRYNDLKTLTTSLDDNLSMMINAYYFYVIYLRTRDDELAVTPISKKIGGGTVNNIPNIASKFTNYKTIIPFLRLLETNETKVIKLENFRDWAIWTKRQGKVSDSWVGRGILEMNLGGLYFKITVINNFIEKIEHNCLETTLFNDLTTKFFYLFMRNANLNYLMQINPDENKLYFGVNQEGQLGLFKGNSITTGVQSTFVNSQLDFSSYKYNMNHNYMFGKHYIEMNKINYHLTALDELIFKDSKINIFDVIDWSSISKSSKNIFMKAIFSGDFGTIDNVNFDKEELISKFLSTDLYKFFYKNSLENKTLTQALWDDILQHLTYSEDIFPTLYESLGLEDLEKILPQNRKDNVALYLFYDTNNDDLLTMRRKAFKIENEDERKKYILEVMLAIKDQHGLITLPEIGDPEEFNKFQYLKINFSNLCSIVQVLSEALLSGYNNLSLKSRQDLSLIYPNVVSNSSMFASIFLYEAYFNELIIDEYTALTPNQIFIHELISKIFEEKSAFVEFAREFRGTIMKNVPRHPRYEDQWQELIANVFQRVYTRKPGKKEKDLIPANTIKIAKLTKFKYSWANEHDIEFVKNRPICPPILSLFMSTDHLNQVDGRDHSWANLNKFVFTHKSILDQKTEWIDFITDDCGFKTAFFRAKKESMKVSIAPTLTHLVRLLNSKKGKENIAIITSFFDPKLPSKEVILEDNRGIKHIMFAYNLNNNMKDVPVKNKTKLLNKSYYKYIDFYLPHIDNRLPFEIERDTKTIEVNFEVPPVFEVVKTVMTPENNESYGPELTTFLQETFNLNEEVCDEINKINNSSFTAIGKYQRIRAIILKFQKESTKFELDKILQRIFKDWKAVNLDISAGVSAKVNLSKTTENPNELIQQFTSYKKEFKQGNTIINNQWGPILMEKIKLTQGVKMHLMANLKLIIQQLKIANLKNEMAMCRYMQEIVKNSAETLIMDSNSQKFDEELRVLMTEQISKITMNDDGDILPVPENQLVEWEFIKK
jgi:hypothetical protein